MSADTIRFLSSLLLSLSLYSLLACLASLLQRTIDANHWYATFRDIAKVLRTSHGYVNAQELADEVHKLAWKILEDDRSRTFHGRRWLKKYKTDKLLEEADRIAGVERK
jgi:hypothetical protein